MLTIFLKPESVNIKTMRAASARSCRRGAVRKEEFRRYFSRQTKCGAFRRSAASEILCNCLNWRRQEPVAPPLRAKNAASTAYRSMQSLAFPQLRV